MQQRKDHSKMSPEELKEYLLELSRKRNRLYRKRNSDRLKKEWAENQEKRDRQKSAQRKLYLSKQDEIKKRQREYYYKNKERVRAYVRGYYQRNKEKLREVSKKWVSRNQEKSRLYKKQHIKRKLQNDPAFRLMTNLRRRIRSLNAKNSDRTMLLIGCSINELKAHLESQWDHWMNWGNYGFGDGKWVVDHIKPCSKFDLLNTEDRLACFHYTNLRPLCWRENLDKSDFYEPQK